MIETHNLGVVLGGVPILTGINLAIGDGEFVAIVGPNGAGKSTLLAALAGDRIASSGQVFMDGHDVRFLRPIELARRRSVLPQQSKTLFSFDASAVVAMGRHPCADAANDRAVVRSCLARVGAQHLAGRSFPGLSGGEQTLVNMARVLAQDAPTVLLDEPTAALDLGHQELICEIAAELAADGRTVVVVLHELNLAAKYANRIIVLDRGTVQADAPPLVAFDANQLSRIYRRNVAVLDHPLVAGRPFVIATPSPSPLNQVMSATI